MKLNDKQIMIIDDDEVLRKLVEKVLQTAGCKVISCHSIKDALENLNLVVPDLVILDLNMPELNGFTFLKFRHLNKNLAAIPVVVLSGTKNKEFVQKAMAMGADQFIEKPFEARIILQKLNYVFLSQANYIYHFPQAELPSLEAEIEGEIVELSSQNFKIESQAKLSEGKTLQILCEDLLKQGVGPLVCKINPSNGESKGEQFRTIIHPTGVDSNGKRQLDDWQRSLIRRI